MIVKHRRGTTKEWRENNIIPEAGELVIEECDDGTRRAKFGTGFQYFSDLPYIDDKLWEELENTRIELNNKITKADNRLSKEIEDTKTAFENKLASEKAIREKELGDLTQSAINSDRQLFEKVEEKEAALRKEFDATASELRSSIDSLDSKATTGISGIGTQLSSVESVFNGKLINHTTLFDKKLDELSDDLVEDYTTKIAKLAESVQANTEDLADLTVQADNNKELIVDSYRDASNRINAVKTAIATQARRIDNLMALPDGSTVADAELKDIRVGYNDVYYESAGAAVRAVGEEVSNLRDSLSQYIGTQAINGLRYDIEGNVGLGAPYMLYLTANGEVLQDTGVQIIGGAGGGPGGGAAGSSELKISYITKDALTITDKKEATLSFLFAGKDSAGDTISQVDAQWKVNGTIVARGIVKSGENSFDASAYVKENDTIKVLLIVTADNGSVATKTWNIQHVALNIASDFNEKIKYTVGEEIIFSYKVEGAINKTAVFKLDGEEIGRQVLEASISGFDRGDISYPIPAYDKSGKLRDHGSYLLEVYLEAELNGDTIASKTRVVKDLIWYDAANVDGMPVIGAAPQSITTKQYAAAEIVFTVYDPSTSTPKVDIEVDGVIVSSPLIEPNPAYDYTTTDVYSYVTDKIGTHIIKIICGKVEKVITVVVESLDINIAPVTTGLAFDFHPVGVSNNDTDKRLWTHGDIHMSVSDNFDWKNGGYQTEKDEDGNSIPGTEHFCIKAGSTATIDYKLFANDAKIYGKEFKLVFKTKHVTNPEAIFLSCVDNKTAQDHIGIQMRVHKANIYGQSGNLELAYSEEDIVEFEFNIAKNTEAIPMVMGYEDGVPSRPMVYDSTYSFKQNNPKEITLGSPDCDLLIYRFKVYDTSLTASDILDNFIADARTSDEMLARHNRNQIYNDNNKFDPDVFAEKCPWLRVYKVSAPHFTNNKSDKVKNTKIQQLYKAGDPVLDNWVCYNAQHSGQGTSSNNYGAAGRNLDFIMNKDGAYFELGDGTTASEITLTRESVPVAYLNAKVNIASSNNLTNAILANRYNRFNPYRRPFVEREGIDTDFIKDTMEFHNCVIFIQETDPDLSTHREFADTDWHFYAIGNIGDSKKTDKTRATDPDDKYECCVEIMDVGLPLSDFPRDTMMNAMGYSIDEVDKVTKHYTWAKDENLGILYERRFTKTTDRVVDLSKTYYVEIDGKMTLAKSYYAEVKDYLWATNENLASGLLYELIDEEYVVSQDTSVDYDKIYYIKEEVKDELDNVISVNYLDAMGYTIKTIKTNDYVTNENIDNLYELEYFLTEDTSVNYNKTYYVDILEHDDFSEDYTYGWRYISDDEDAAVVNACKQAWIDFYRFVTTSTDEYFKEHFEDYFVKDSALYYYLFTTRYCMVDNRAKNTFWHFSKTGKYRAVGEPRTALLPIYYEYVDGVYVSTQDTAVDPAKTYYTQHSFDLCWDYDNDTSLGLNNYGKQVYRYGLEDTDRDAANMEIFRESDSTFFCRIRDLFASELQTMYKDLESKDAWHAESFINECDTWQEEFPEELWRLDINRKYIRTYNSSFIKGAGDKQFLVNMCNGKMKYHRRQWERNQEVYMASKYQTNRALGDNYHANFRVNRFESTEGMAVAPNYEFTLTPYSHVYLNVQYGGTKPISVRAEPNVATTVPFSGALSADIINIGSAAAISDFGDLSAIYPHTASVQNATRVKTLKLGTDTEGYSNANFTSLTTGENALLEQLDLTNITSYTGSLNLEKLLNLKKLYAFGTGLTSIIFADGGKLDYIELPAVNNITLRNLRYLSSDNLKLFNNNYNNVTELVIENCSLIRALELFDKCKNILRVRLVGVDFGTVVYDEFVNKFSKNSTGDSISGITASGESTANAALIGKAKFSQLTGAQFNNLKTRYPDLEIAYDHLESSIIFKDTDLTTTLGTGTSVNGADGTNPVHYGTGSIPEGMIAKPTKASTDEFDYDFVGWWTAENIVVPSENLTDELLNKYKVEVLEHIEGDKVFYPVFQAIRRNYIVTFINPTAPSNKQLLAEISTPYGSDADFAGSGYMTPTKQDAAKPELYEFTGWEPKPEKITGPMTCYAQFTIRDDVWYTIGVGDISDCTDPKDGATFDGYTLNSSNNTMTITKCKNEFNSAVRIPNTLSINATPYTITKIGGTRSGYLGGFSGHTTLELIDLPDNLEELLTGAFSGCTKLSEVTLPNSLRKIGDNAFGDCTKLETIEIPANVHTIGDAPLRNCYNLESITVAPENPAFVVKQDCLIDVNSKKLLQGITTSVIPDDGSVTSLSTYCFSKMQISEVTIPSGITRVPSNAFSYCTALKEVTFDNPNTVTSLDATCFAWCSNLSDINLPEGLKEIKTYVFADCALKNVTIPSSVTLLDQNSFGDIDTLQTVTFKKGAQPPVIHPDAFKNSGKATAPITFNVPWSEAEHNAYYTAGTFFGAKAGIINYNYNEEVN